MDQLQPHVQQLEKENNVLREQLFSLGENLPNGCLFSFEMNMETRQISITHLTKNWERITHVSIEKSLEDANSVFQKIHPNDLPVLMNTMARSFETLENFSIEVRYFYSKDDLKWIYLASHPRVENGTGKSDALIMDISDRKYTELQLLSEKERLQALGDNFPNGTLFRFETDMNIEKMILSYMSGTWEETLNVSIRDSANDMYSVLSKIHPDDLPSTLDAIAESVRTLNDFNVEVRYFYTGNDMRWMQISSRPHIENNKVISDGFILDITQRRQISQELLKEKERMQTLGDNLPNGILFRFEMDRETQQMKFTYLSQRWQEISNLSIEQATNDFSSVLAKIHPDDRDYLVEKIRENVIRLVKLDVEVRYNKTENETIWVHVSSQPRVDAEHNRVISDGFILDITDRKNISQELLSEKERMQTLGDNFPNGCLYRMEFNRSTHAMFFSYLSKQWEAFSGLSIEQSLDSFSTAISKVYPDDRDYLFEKIEESLTNLTFFNVEIRFYNKDSEVRWLQVSSYPRPEGKMIVCDGFMLDITDRKNISQELLSEKERLQTLGDNLPNGCLYRLEMNRKTSEVKFTYLSKKWEAFAGTTIEESLNDFTVAMSRIYPDDAALVSGKITDSLVKLIPFDVEARYFNKYDDIGWLQILASPRVEGHMVISDGILLEISDRKKTELELENYRFELEKLVKERTEELEISMEELSATNEELYSTNEEFAAINEELQQRNDQLRDEMVARKKVMAQLEDSEERLRNFVEQSFEGIILTDKKGVVLEWNRSQEMITGLKAGQTKGLNYWDLLFSFQREEEQSDEKYLELQKEYTAYFSGGHQQKPIVQESSLHYKDGSIRYILFSIFPIGFSDDYLFGSIVRDITDQKLIEIELEQYRTQLEQMVEIKTRELTASQERLMSLSNNLPGGMIFQIVNEGGKYRFSYISASFADMFRINVDEASGNIDLFTDIIHPDDKDLFVFPDTCNMVDFQFRVIAGHKELKWIHVRATCNSTGRNGKIWDGFMIDTTERKQIEQKLEESNRQQNILIRILQIVQSTKNIPDAINEVLGETGEYVDVSRTYIFERSADGKKVSNTYEWCNTGIEPVIGYLQNIDVEENADMAGPWFDMFETEGYIYASDIRELTEEIYEFLKPQGIKSILIIPLKINDYIYGFIGFDECIHYKKWNQTEIQLLISVSQIISAASQRYQAEQSILLSQQTMRTVLDNIDANIYVADFETSEILFANRRVKEEIGEDLEGKLCWNALQQKNAPCEFCPNQYLLTGDKQPTGLYHWEHRNLTTRKWYECTDAAIEWIDGRLVHMEYATDVTERKKAEEALLQSEEMYRQLTVASPDAIVMCDTDYNLKYLSPKAKELFLIPAEADIDSLRIKDFVHPHELEKAIDTFGIFTRDNMSYIPQILLMRNNGSEFFGEISAASVKNTQGETLYVILVIRDITERKKSETELIRAKEKAEESDKLKSAFLANMSHEIRTPINGIIGFLNFLADENLSSKRRREYITVINNSSVQLVNLIDDIIDVAKIEAGQMSIQPVPFDLNGFLYELRVFFETYLQSNNKDRIMLILDDSMFLEESMIYVDPMRLRQVLTNLIGNAIKFTEKGYIRFGYARNGNMLEFFVEDTGSGIPETQIEVIFERFRQAEYDNNRHYGGTGLGLTISKSLVQMMGGDIQVQSQINVGSGFTFSISYIPVGEEEKEILERKPSLQTNEPDMSRKEKVVLLVEPNLMKRKYYETLLVSAGASVLCADSINQWIDHLSRSNHIDLVIASQTLIEEEAGEYKKIKSFRAGLPLILIANTGNRDASPPKRNKKYPEVLAEPVGLTSFKTLLNKWFN